MAQHYRSQVRPTATAIAALLCAAGGLAILLAVSWQWLGAYGEILFAGTIVRGLLVGWLLSWVCRKSHFSKPRLAAAISILATLAAIIGSGYVAHRQNRAVALADADELRTFSTGSGRDISEVQEEYESTAARLTYINYLRGYYGFEGQAKDGTAALWGPWLGLALYGLEILAALAMASLYPIGQASEPACQRCGRWQQETHLGCAAHGNSMRFIESMLSSDLDGALALLDSPDTKEQIEFSLAQCSSGHDQDQGGVLRIRDRVYGSRDRTLRLLARADLVVDQIESDAITGRLGEWK